MVHQLAAKKAIAELEQGRGWLPEAKDKDTGKLLKEQHESQFSDMVEREAVRLGVQFQVGGKWCSFVALEKGKEIADERMSEDFEFLDFDSGVSDVHGEWPLLRPYIEFTASSPDLYCFYLSHHGDSA
jgi:hypothetical protein